MSDKSDVYLIDYSVVIPIYNEEENIQQLYGELKEELQAAEKEYEIIFVDDGSDDRSAAMLYNTAGKDPYVRIIRLGRHSGKSVAVQKGFNAAAGRYIITMDGDLQYDVRDIPRFLQKILYEKNADVICGWRQQRKDPFVKILVSFLANLLRRLIFKESIHDVGCFFRIYKREALENIHLAREQHRFLTAILKKRGHAIQEMVIRHLPRLRGKSKFGYWDRFSRSVPDFWDLIKNNNSVK